MTFEALFNIKEDLWTYLAKTEKPIIMYGTGNGADKIINVFEAEGIKLSGIFASDDFARGQNFRGFTVRKYSDFCAEYNDFIVVVSFASQRDEVLSNIYRICAERECYAPDVPVFGDGLFNLDYFNQNKDRLKAVYDLLSDDISQNTFVMSIAFKLTGKIDYLKACEICEEESTELIASLLKSYNYVDIGAYTGDTVEAYVNRFGKGTYLYAFEPDERNYRKMLERFDNLKIECHTFNAAAWNKNETLRFYSNSGRAGSAVKGAQSKYKDITAIRADSVIDTEIGFVKIDAEGSDLQVIEGLSEIIEKYRPVIKVAAYHRNEDFFVLPEKMLELAKEFKLYMRHLKYVPGWDTDFIFDLNI